MQNILPSIQNCDISPDKTVNANTGNEYVIPDDNLIRSALAGNPLAHDRLYRRYKGRIHRICLDYFGGNVDQADDLCQETFIRAFNRLNQLHDREKFFPWLKEIARNNCVSFIRKESTKSKIMSQYEVITQTVIENERQWSEQEFQIIDDLIREIKKPDLRETVKLYYTEGKKTTEIAEIQNISQTLVTTRLNRFRARFRMRIIMEIMERRESEL